MLKFHFKNAIPIHVCTNYLWKHSHRHYLLPFVIVILIYISCFLIRLSRNLTEPGQSPYVFNQALNVGVTVTLLMIVKFMVSIVCVSLAGPWCSDTWSNLILNVSMSVCFRVTCKLMDFEQSILPSTMCMARIQSAWKKQQQKMTSPEQEGNLLALKLTYQLFPWYWYTLDI